MLCKYLGCGGCEMRCRTCLALAWPVKAWAAGNSASFTSPSFTWWMIILGWVVENRLQFGWLSDLAPGERRQAGGVHAGQQPLGLHLHLEHHHAHQVPALVGQPGVLPVSQPAHPLLSARTLGSGGTISAEGQKHRILTSSMYLGKVSLLTPSLALTPDSWLPRLSGDGVQAQH